MLETGWYIACLIVKLFDCMHVLSLPQAHLIKMHGFMSYGHWDFCDGVPVPHYLEPPVVHSRRVHFFREQDEDPFRGVQQLAAPCCHHHRDQMKKTRTGEKLQGKKQGRVCYVSSTRKPKAVDEDLYKIPPELLYQLPKRKRVLGNFLYGCLGLNCIG